MHFPFACFDGSLNWEVKYEEALFCMHFLEACSEQAEFISANVLEKFNITHLYMSIEVRYI